VDVLIIDDPVKDRMAAESPTIRENTWEWWESVALTRLAPGARVVLIQTRWHEDDLAGRIASRPSPLKWRVLRIPAIADSPDDPLGREIGQELPSVRGREPGHFHHLQATMSPYVFAGVYQQAPQAAEGNFFRKASFRYWRHMEPWADGRQRIWCEGQPVTLQDCWRFVTMDFAASSKSTADYTVASMWAVAPGGDLILLDRRRGRIPDHEHYKMAAELQGIWGPCTIYVEQNWWSKGFTKDAQDAGVGVAGILADTDKVTRAIPAAGRVHSGRVYFPAETSGCECGTCTGAWLSEWCEELAIFPQGTHDDQVDTLSYAVRVQINEWTAAPLEAPRPGLSKWESAADQAQAAATGQGTFDPMTVQYLRVRGYRPYAWP
jgi:predicted phage terminase large subunit-like protein